MKSPFKFLDPYQKEDAATFFGRERETAQLYNAVFASNLTLLYGASGTGKTSLVNCGLGNKFYETDWLPLFIRREGQLLEAVDRAIWSAFPEGSPMADAKFSILPLHRKVELLYLQVYKPIYLIFDQLEELFILSSGQQEQEQFYQTIAELLQSGVQAKVLLILREEWIAYLNEFEKYVPNLFDNRLRIEKMNDKSLYRVISGTCRYHQIEVNQPANTILQIINNLRHRREGVELTHLQVYLDRLYREDLSRQGKPESDRIRFDPELVNEKVGKVTNVLSDFLDEQFERIEADLAQRGVQKPKGIPLDILYILVTEDGTKKSATAEAIYEQLPQNRAINQEDVEWVLVEFQNMKILRRIE